MFPSYAVVHVTGYMLALGHQGQEAVSPIALPLMQNPFAALRYDLFKQLRLQMSQDPAEG